MLPVSEDLTDETETNGYGRSVLFTFSNGAELSDERVSAGQQHPSPGEAVRSRGTDCAGPAVAAEGAGRCGRGQLEADSACDIPFSQPPSE